jgi:hypothetical protein
MGSSPTGKIAIFSVWEALGAESPAWAAPFGGEGEGWSVRIPFAWEVGQTYRFALSRSGPGGAADVGGAGDGVAGSAGDEWTCTVDDTVIGTINVDPRWGGLDATSIMWTERYAGPLRSCADIAFSSAVFGEPTANRGTVHPVAHRNHLGQPPGCPGSTVTDQGPGLGVRHVMGGHPVR